MKLHVSFILFCSSFVPHGFCINVTLLEELGLSSSELVGYEPPIASASGYVQDSSSDLKEIASSNHVRADLRKFLDSPLPITKADEPFFSGDCQGQLPGYFGDQHDDCKTFEVCQSDGRLNKFYCPPYTKFNNYLSICDWHFRVDGECNPIAGYYDFKRYGGEPAVTGERGELEVNSGNHVEIPEVFIDVPRKVYKPTLEAKLAARTINQDKSEDGLTGYDKIYFPNPKSPYLPNYIKNLKYLKKYS